MDHKTLVVQYLKILIKCFSVYHSGSQIGPPTRCYFKNAVVRTPDVLSIDPVATKKKKALHPHFASGNQHLAFEVAPEKYQSWKDQIEDAGIPITHEQTWKRGQKSFYFNDPEQNVLEIVQTGMWD